MLPKATLTFLVLGALSVNALVVQVSRSPVPEPESQQTKARVLSGPFWGHSSVQLEVHPPAPAHSQAIEKAKKGMLDKILITVTKKIGLA